MNSKEHQVERTASGFLTLGVVRIYTFHLFLLPPPALLLLLIRTSTVSSRSQRAASDRSRGLKIAVGSAGPEWELLGSAGPQRGVRQRSGAPGPTGGPCERSDQRPRLNRGASERCGRRRASTARKNARRYARKTSENMSERMPERTSEEMPKRMSGIYVRRNARKNARKNVRKNVSRNAKKNVRKIRYVRRNARKNVRRCVGKERQEICQTVLGESPLFASSLQVQVAVSVHPHRRCVGQFCCMRRMIGYLAPGGGQPFAQVFHRYWGLTCRSARINTLPELYHSL